MENSSDLETKYQKLATEYSKIRSQASVLKKAVLDEQARNSDLRDIIKKHEQQIRKHDQEMESLIFRNEQLTKRISFLQNELQVCNTRNKKQKGKISDDPAHSDMSILDEELHKKILENAQLLSSISDKDNALTNCKEKVDWLESKVTSLQQVIADLEEKKKEKVNKLNRQQPEKETMSGINTTAEENIFQDKKGLTEIEYWKEEAQRWKNECKMLHSKPDTDTELADYYESQIHDLLESNQLSCSETRSLWAENSALNHRLEQLIIENKHLESCLTKSNEELVTTSENYKIQLDAMTEHLASQNEKITKQCDEIQHLKHKMTQKK